MTLDLPCTLYILHRTLTSVSQCDPFKCHIIAVYLAAFKVSDSEFDGQINTAITSDQLNK